MDSKKLPILLIPSALLAGVTLFLVVTLNQAIDFKHFTFTFNQSETSSLLLPFGVMFAICNICSVVIPRFIKSNTDEAPVQFIIRKICIQYALLEGVAFFGLVMIMNQYSNEKAVSFSFVWLGLLGYISVLLTYIKDLPKLIKLIKSETEE